MQYIVSNAVFIIVIAKAEPEAIHVVFWIGFAELVNSVASRFVPRVRNDEHGIEILFSEEI